MTTKQTGLLAPLSLILISCGLWPEMELLVPSLPDMKTYFEISEAYIQNLLTVNFTGFLFGVLLSGPLNDRYGRKNVLSWGLLGYLLCSFFCALTDSFELLMILRFFQGFFMTGPVIASGLLMFTLTKDGDQVFWLSLQNSVVTFCMAMAPITGSWMNERFGFHGNLWCIFLLGLITSIPCLLFVQDPLPSHQRAPFRGKDFVQSYKERLLDSRFMTLAFAVCSLAAAYWIYVGISALYMVDYLKIAKADYGLYQGPIVGTFSILSLANSRINKRFGLRICLKIGKILMFLGSFSVLALCLLGKESPLFITLGMMVFVGGMAPVCGSIFPLTIAHLPQEKQGTAMSLTHVIRLSIASLGTFSVSLVYTGSLTPVAFLMMGILIISLILLKKQSEILR